MLEVTILGSSSKGNCIAVRDEDGTVIVDAGLRPTKIVAALEDNGIDLENVHAVLISHEHMDHVQGLRALAKAVPGAVVMLTPLTAKALEEKNKLPVNWIVLPVERAVYVGGRMEVTAFHVQHDAADPLGFRIQTHSGEEVAIATDMGSFSTQSAERPQSLKDRIWGDRGHLSNLQAAALARAVIGPISKCIFGVHMSADCNTEELAMDALVAARLAVGRGDIRCKIVTTEVVREVVDNERESDNHDSSADDSSPTDSEHA
jgi:phosphoribosyl 1,2-cyclic phosphodiesterase